MRQLYTNAVTAFCTGVVSILCTGWIVRTQNRLGKIITGSHDSGVIPVDKKINVYTTRAQVDKVRIEITNRASAGDTIFGSCRGCYSDDASFHDALANAVARGVTLQCIVSMTDSSRELRTFLGVLDKSKVHLWTCKDDYLRTYGIEGREVMFAFDLGNRFFGVHLIDSALLNLLAPGLRSLRQQSIEG